MRKTGPPQGQWGQQKPMPPKSGRKAASPWLQGRKLVDRAQVVRVLGKLGISSPGHSLFTLYKLWVSSLSLEPKAGRRKCRVQGAVCISYHLSMMGSGSSPCKLSKGVGKQDSGHCSPCLPCSGGGSSRGLCRGLCLDRSHMVTPSIASHTVCRKSASPAASRAHCFDD